MLQLAREIAAGSHGDKAARGSRNRQGSSQGASGGGNRPPPPCHLVDVAVDSGRDLLLSFSDGSKRTLPGCQVGRAAASGGVRQILKHCLVPAAYVHVYPRRCTSCGTALPLHVVM